MKHLLAGVLRKTETAVHVALRKSKEPTHTKENKVGWLFGKHSVTVPLWYGCLAVIDLDQLPGSIRPATELDNEQMKPFRNMAVGFSMLIRMSGFLIVSASSVVRTVVTMSSHMHAYLYRRGLGVPTGLHTSGLGRPSARRYALRPASAEL